MREPGFYWVYYGPEWIVAEWNGIEWNVTHNCAPYTDSDFEKISLTKIHAPLKP